MVFRCSKFACGIGQNHCTIDEILQILFKSGYFARSSGRTHFRKVHTSRTRINLYNIPRINLYKILSLKWSGGYSTRDNNQGGYNNAPTTLNSPTPHFGSSFERPSGKMHFRKTHPTKKSVVCFEHLPVFIAQVHGGAIIIPCRAWEHFHWI